MPTRHLATPFSQPALASLLLLLVSALSAPAAPADELLRLVPDDVGFCLVVRDLRGHAAALLQSPLAEHFRSSPQGAALLGGPELAKLAEVEKLLQAHLGLDWARFRDEILGDAIVFAYRPGPPGQAEKDEQGLLLVRARDGKLLAELVDRFNRTQKESGDLKELEPREHHGTRYFRREDRKQAQFYYLNGPVLAFSGQEAILRRAIDLDRTAAAGDEPPVARQLRLLGADRKLAALWINPRAFLPELEWKAANAKPEEAAVLRAFSGYWKALDGAALSLALDKEAEFTLAVRAQPDQLPAAAQRFFAEAGKPSELWGLFPDDALLAVVGRLDLPALADLVGEFLTEEARKAARDALDRSFGAALGRDFFKDVLPCLGPDVGLFVVPPAASQKSWVPQAVLAVRVRSGDSPNRVDQALLSAVHSFALLAVLSHNQKHADQLRLRSELTGGEEIKYLTGDQRFPEGFRPAFALRNGYLVFGSSPEAVRRLGAVKSARAGEDVPLLRLSLQALRRYLQERREPVVTAVAEANQLTKEEAARRIDSFAQGTSLFDRVEVHERAGQGQFTLTVRVQMTRPLRK